MLRDLHIKNLAVVAEASIRFGDGFNVLTGETGAGKSIVVDALALLAGARASNDLIRSGADRLTVTGVFAPSGSAWRTRLADVGIEPEGDELIIRREIAAEGTNRVFVNDQPATLRLVQTLAPELLRIHGQREELGLVAPDLQRAWLDRCGGPKGRAVRVDVAEAFESWSRLADRLARREGAELARHERIDFLRFQLGELEEAAVEVDEEVALRRERDVLRHAEAIGAAVGNAAEFLFDIDGSVYERLTEAHRQLTSITEWEPDATTWARELEEQRIHANDLADTLRRRMNGLEADPRRLAEIEDRLAWLERLMRKHGGSTEALLERQATLTAELAELERDENDEAGLQAESIAALGRYEDLALTLSAARARWATGLSKRTRHELNDLALGRARFEIALERRGREASPLEVEGRATAFTGQGIDHVVFRFSPNPGEAPKPLAKAASGGELSRLYLAVQLATRRNDPGASQAATTMVFDEVDSGIGGAEAAALGEKLHRLADGGQILAVTHLPQVASQGDVHFKIRKAVRRGRTHTLVEALDPEGRASEIARMLAGTEITDLSLSHARELLAGGER